MTYKYICYYVPYLMEGLNSKAHGEGTGMNRALLAATLAISLLAACGDGGGPRQQAEATPDPGPDTVRIEVVDTLGVMMGDSAYVFGNITDATMTADGRLLVLDGLKSRIGIFDESLEPLGFVGRSGSGPGEYQYPRSFALLDDGGLVVCDWAGRSITYLDGEMEVDTIISDFVRIAPDRIVPCPGGNYVGMSLEHGVEDGQPVGENFIARFGRSTEPEVVYCAYPMRFSADEDGDLNVHTTGLAWDTGPDGSVWVAVVSDSTWEFTGCTLEGDTIRTISREWDRVEKTQEELEEGLLHETLSTGSESGSSVNRERRYDIVGRYHEAITSLDVDGQGRIWIGQGWTDIPVFDVYSPGGELLFVATIPGMENQDGLSFCFDHGMIGFDTQPDDYPKVYLLRLEESL